MAPPARPRQRPEPAGETLRIPLGPPWWRGLVLGVVIAIGGLVVILVATALDSSTSWLLWLIGLAVILAGVAAAVLPLRNRQALLLSGDGIRFPDGVLLPWWTVQSIGPAEGGRQIGFALSNRQPVLASLQAQRGRRTRRPLLKVRTRGSGSQGAGSPGWDLLLPASVFNSDAAAVARQLNAYRASLGKDPAAPTLD